MLDYVLLHELAHLLSTGHGPQFWALLGGYPHTERARGFLDGWAFAEDVAEPEDGDGWSGTPEPVGGEGGNDALDHCSEPERGDGRPGELF